MADRTTASVSRRVAVAAGASLGLGGLASATEPVQGAEPGRAGEPAVVYGPQLRPGRREGPLSVGSLVFPRMDQIDFTGPFEVFARIPDTKVDVVAKTTAPVQDVKGLTITPTIAIKDAPSTTSSTSPAVWVSRPSPARPA